MRFPLLGRVAVSHDLNLAAQAVGGGQIRVVNLDSGQELWTAQAAAENVTALAFSADGKKLASGAGFVESAVRLWDVATGRELARLEGHRTYVRSLVFWPDGETLASASGDQTIHLWDVSSVSPVSTWSESQFRRPTRTRANELHPNATLRGHRLEVWSLALGPDNTTLVSGSKDGAVYVWDTAAKRREQSNVTLPAPVLAWNFLADSRAILALDKQGRVARWQGNDFQQSQPLLEIGTNAFAACFSADGRYLATVSPEGTTQVWDVQQGGLLPEVTPKAGWDLPVKFLDRSNHLVTQRRNDSIFREWDVTSGREIRSWQFSGPGPTWKSAFSPDDQCFVALDGEGGGQLRHLATKQDMRLDLKQVSGTAFSPDGRLLAAVSILGIGHLYDAATGRKTATLQGFLQGAHSVSFSPDGQRLAIGSNGNEAIKLWDVESLQELLTLKGVGSIFNSVTFSPDGNVLASANSQGILHIWRAPSFEDIARSEAQRR
jgi:WD40 repeat protein